MHMLVLVLGLVALAAGFAALGLGFSIKEFSLGGTVLIIGAMAVLGGLVMIAAAGIIRALQRIAQALNRQAAAARAVRPGEPMEPYAPGAFRAGMSAPRVPPVMPPPVMPPPPVSAPGDFDRPAPDFRPREPQPQAAPVERTAFAPSEPVPELTEPVSPSLQPRGQSAADTDIGSTPLQEPESVPLSPQDSAPTPDLFDMPDDRRTSEVEEEPQEPVSQEPASQEPASQAAIAREVSGDTPSEEPPEPPPERGRPTPFDAIWPPLRTRDPSDRTETETDDEEARRASWVAGGVDRSVAVEEAPDLAAESDEPTREQAEEAAGESTTEAAYAVSILKSGVVDDMAYTLYSDGSIEAELPTGTIRFASIHELRTHLEKTE